METASGENTSGYRCMQAEKGRPSRTCAEPSCNTDLSLRLVVWLLRVCSACTGFTPAPSIVPYCRKKNIRSRRPTCSNIPPMT